MHYTREEVRDLLDIPDITKDELDLAFTLCNREGRSPQDVRERLLERRGPRKYEVTLLVHVSWQTRGAQLLHIQSELFQGFRRCPILPRGGDAFLPLKFTCEARSRREIEEKVKGKWKVRSFLDAHSDIIDVNVEDVFVLSITPVLEV